MDELFQVILLLFLIVGYIIGGIYTSKYLSKHLQKHNIHKRIILLSLFQSLYFGIGILASGGEPGFGFPAPNLLAIVFISLSGNFQIIPVAIFIWLLWFLLIAGSKWGDHYIYLWRLKRYTRKKEKEGPN